MGVSAQDPKSPGQTPPGSACNGPRAAFALLRRRLTILIMARSTRKWSRKGGGWSVGTPVCIQEMREADAWFRGKAAWLVPFWMLLRWPAGIACLVGYWIVAPLGVPLMLAR